jgi:hypothetical protein
VVLAGRECGQVCSCAVLCRIVYIYVLMRRTQTNKSHSAIPTAYTYDIPSYIYIDTTKKTFAHACISERFLRIQESFSVKEMLVISEYTKTFVGILLWDKDIVLITTL